LMADMPRPRPPHLHREETRHGKAVWYVRVGKGPRVRLWAEYGTPEFAAEYQAAVSGAPHPNKGAPAVGTLAWLIARYRETTAWAGLSVATRRQRENIFKHVIEQPGQLPTPRSPARRFWTGASAGRIHRHRRATSSTPCAGCFAGR
jgi:hypothetical protein